MAESKSIALTYAAALQEVGILFFVFGPLQLTFESTIAGWLLAIGMIIWILLGLALFRIGIEIQRRQQ
jgi:hypothetical protein